MQAQTVLLGTSLPASSPPEELSSIEIWWREHYDWLVSKGYRLRTRYEPNWSPSWKKTGQHYLDCEDGIVAVLKGGVLLDATRVSDEKLVQLKLVRRDNEDEARIALRFSSEPLISDSRNCCIPILEVIDVNTDPEWSKLIVMPFLRPLDSPKFQTLGEAVEFLRQIFEGLSFLHEHSLAHRDIAYKNIMMDGSPLFPNGFSSLRDWEMRNRNGKGWAKYRSRTSAPVNYYIIDFGLTYVFPNANGPFEVPFYFGNDRSVPEYQGLPPRTPVDPFPVDVYCLGNLIQTEFIDVKQGFDFIIPLVNDMRNPDPSKRITMKETARRLADLVHGLSWWRLRSRLRNQTEKKLPGVISLAGDTYQAFKTIYYVSTLKPALPSPKRPKQLRSLVQPGQKDGITQVKSWRISRSKSASSTART